MRVVCTAVHEAAHAVVGAVLGFEPSAVTVASDERTRGQAFFERLAGIEGAAVLAAGELAVGLSVTYPEKYPRPAYTPPRCGDRLEVTTSTRARRARARYERTTRRRTAREAQGNDWELAERLAGGQLLEASGVAWDVLRANWEPVYQLAELLLEHGTLEGPELAAALGGFGIERRAA